MTKYKPTSLSPQIKKILSLSSNKKILSPQTPIIYLFIMFYLKEQPDSFTISPTLPHSTKAFQLFSLSHFRSYPSPLISLSLSLSQQSALPPLSFSQLAFTSHLSLPSSCRAFTSHLYPLPFFLNHSLSIVFNIRETHVRIHTKKRHMLRFKK